MPLAAAAALALAGCHVLEKAPEEDAGVLQLARYIEVEVDDPDRGLPCRVIDREASGDRQILWHAEFERGFCARKAQETRLVLQARGWACGPLDPGDRPATASPASSQVVAAWRCFEGLESGLQTTAASPPLPATRPDSASDGLSSIAAAPESSLPSDHDLLNAAVERDLSAIGQDIVGSDSTVQTALGDLNGDGIDDAVAVLTRDAGRVIPHRMLMAYLRDGDGYNLVDVWILRPPHEGQDGRIDLAIEDGRVQLGACCAGRDGPMSLVLDNRKLAYADGG